ncbi:MAG: serine/threonine protein kinase [Phycisphaerae bacterium]|nr:serine/threonine protein kinase [Phycisphaerae bacterium]
MSTGDHPTDPNAETMDSGNFPTDPNAETVGLPSDDSGKGSVPEFGKLATQNMPTEIGRYRILGVIASGGMGVVYEAMQEAPRRRVALKIIKAGAASEMALHRFHFEAQTLAKLSHPNIAQIYEAGTWESEQGKTPFFAMEYIPGASGIVSYAEKKNLSIHDRLSLFAKICKAVHHGHQKGVIHRDLKPDNILVDNNGEPKIIDFGVARATDADLTVTTMQTTMGQLIGTLQYMSPEQCDADPDRIDTRSDVYALGVILFQLLSGKLPYDLRRQAIHEAVRVIKETRPISMATINTTLKGDVDTIALKAMEKDRDRRYQSAAELASDIHHFLNNEPIIARPLSIGYQVRLFTKKYKRTCAAVVLLAISIILGIIGTSTGMMVANTQRAEAVKQRDIAEGRYEAILDISQDVLGDFYSGVVKLNAALDVRKLVLDSSMNHLDNLEGTAGATEDIRSAKAQTHSLLGQFYAGLSGSNLGDVSAARKHQAKAIELYVTLLNEGDTRRNYDLALCYVDLSQLDKLEKKYGDSLKNLDTAFEYNIALLKAHPEFDGGERHKNRVLTTKLDVLNKLGRSDDAEKILVQLVAAHEKAAQESRNDLKLKRDYANILLRAGKSHLKGDAVERSIQEYELARDIYISLVESEPENGRAPRDLAWGYYFLGEANLANNQQEIGLDNIETGLGLVQNRCIVFHEDADARNDLSRYIGAYLWHCGELDLQERPKKNCYAVLLALQPVIEGNPSNYALGEIYSQIQEWHDNIGLVAVAEEK